MFTAPPTLYEAKVYTFANKKIAQGSGTREGCAKPSTAEGHLVAFGGTEERLRHENLVTAQIGDAQGPRFDRDTGVGYVAAHSGDYRDAIGKGYSVNLEG